MDDSGKFSNFKKDYLHKINKTTSYKAFLSDSSNAFKCTYLIKNVEGRN